MSIQEHLSAFAEGWNRGDLKQIMSSLAPDFRLHDPNAGEFDKNAIPAYFDGLKETVAGIRKDSRTEPLMEMSEVVMNEAEGIASVWAWWTVPGTSISGSALLKVTDEGIRSERLSYYTKLPG